MKYDVFISSKSEDYPIAEGIYKFLTGKNYRVFLANKEIPNVGDAEYKNTIDEAIDQTRHLIVVVSNTSYANSKWVKYEWQLFANEKLSGRKPGGNVLTICADSVQIGNLPIGLRNYQSLPLSSYQETICQFLKKADKKDSSVSHRSTTPKFTKRQAGHRTILTDNDVEYAFRWCPPGTFMMGSPEDEPGRSNDELQHEVTLTKGFWMLETPVTQRMWTSVMMTDIQSLALMGTYKTDLYGIGDFHPIYYTSWYESQAFCEKLTEKLNGKITLPTEAQWEYACRAGTRSGYAGDLYLMGWYRNNSHGTTHSVGQKQPNAWGFYDMHGNIWEWCSDNYGPYNEWPTNDPTGPNIGPYKVRRGGSWCNTKRCRSANRGYDAPNGRYSRLGFRIVLTELDK